MRYYFITFRSITFAQRAESILQKAGIACNLQRTPRYMEQQGCGYTIRVHEAAAQRAVHLLRQYQVSYRKLYLRLDSGVMEEVRL